MQSRCVLTDCAALAAPVRPGSTPTPCCLRGQHVDGTIRRKMGLPFLHEQQAHGVEFSSGWLQTPLHVDKGTHSPASPSLLNQKRSLTRFKANELQRERVLTRVVTVTRAARCRASCILTQPSGR
ncbi:transmembrane protein 250 isoform 2-T5 [Porphyrio hochstetteri]